MPRIPLLDADKVIKSPFMSPEMASAPANAIARAGQDMTRTGLFAAREIGEYEEKERRSQRALKAIQIENQLRDDVGVIAESFSTRIDYDKFEDDANEQLKTVRTKYNDLIGEDKDLALAFERVYQGKSSELMKVVRNKKNQVVTEQAIGQFQTLYNQSLKDYAWETTPEARDLVRSQLQLKAYSLVNSHILTPAQAETYIQKFVDESEHVRAEQWIDADPQAALEALRGGSFDTISPQLKEQLIDKAQVGAERQERQKDVDKTNIAYLDIKDQFKGDIQGAIDFLYDEKNMAGIAGGIDVQQQQYLINVLEAEQRQADFREKTAKDEARNTDLNGIAAAIRAGDVAEAFFILKKSEAIDDIKKLEIETSLRKQQTSGTDPVIYQDIIKRIQDGNIKYESEIMLYTGRGITENNEQFLKQLLKDVQTDPDKVHYLKQSEEYFDSIMKMPGFKDTAFSLYKPEFLNELHKQAMGQNDTGKKLRGEQLYEWTKKYIGSTKDIYDPWFWEEGGTEGKILKSPFGEKVRSGKNAGEKQPEQKAELKTFKIGSKGSAVAIKIDDIPDTDRKQVEDYLRKNRKAVTEQNILRVYQTSKGAK